MKAKRLLKILLPLALVLIQVAVVFASEAAGGHGAEAAHEAGAHAEHAGGHPLPWSDFMWRMINFIIFVGIIWKVAGKKIAAFFRGRREEIEHKLTDLSARREDAEKRLREVEKNIANLKQEREKILQEFNKQGEDQKAAIIEKAEKDAQKLRDQAMKTAEQERQTALQRIRAELADLVVSAAEDNIKGKLDKAEHEKLIDKYLTKVVPS